jgi:hypothetical protein
VTFQFIRVSQNTKEDALKRWMHAQVRLLQEKETTLLELCDNWISTNDQTLHSIAKIIDWSVFTLSNLDVDNIIDVAFLITERGGESDLAALEKVYREKKLVLTN